MPNEDVSSSVGVLQMSAEQKMNAGSFEKSTEWPVAQQLPMPLAVRIPLQRMTLRALRELQEGDVLESLWPVAQEVPLYVGGVALSWCEFAVVDGEMAVRMTRLG